MTEQLARIEDRLTQLEQVVRTNAETLVRILALLSQEPDDVDHDPIALLATAVDELANGMDRMRVDVVGAIERLG